MGSFDFDLDLDLCLGGFTIECNAHGLCCPRRRCVIILKPKQCTTFHKDRSLLLRYFAA